MTQREFTRRPRSGIDRSDTGRQSLASARRLVNGRIRFGLDGTLERFFPFHFKVMFATLAQFKIEKEARSPMETCGHPSEEGPEGRENIENV